jgi:hypothetical protein
VNDILIYTIYFDVYISKFIYKSKFVYGI